MEMRTTQWLTGYELLEKRLNDIDNDLQIIQSFLKLPLPKELIEYFKNYKPIDYSNHAYYSELIEFEKGHLILSNSINEIEFDVEYLYDVEEIRKILATYDNSTLEGIHNRMKICPIASNGSNEGDIAISLDENKFGKIYNLYDLQDSETDDSNLLSPNIIEFIKGLKIVPYPKDFYY